MKKHISLLALLLGLSILCPNKKLNAEVNEFSEKVNGDIYGQVKVIDDVDGDGNKDLIFGATDGKIHIYSSKGQEIFRPPYWPKQVNGPITAGIEVADLDGKGNINILASTMEGTFYCLNSKGKELWKYNTGGGVLVSPPLVADMDGEGKKTIILNSSSGRITLLQSDGSIENIVKMDSPVRANPIAADINNRGVKEIIVKDSGGKIAIINRSGVTESEWFTGGDPEGQWPFNIDVTDIDGDGVMEVFGTDTKGSSGFFKMWDYDGNELSSFPISDAAHGAPGVADIDGDGIDDFIIAQSDGKVLVCDKDGKPKKGWPYNFSDYTIYSQPTIIDIDGDGFPEIVYTANNGACNDDKAGCVIALNKEGKIMNGFPRYIGKTTAPLTFADLDGDGVLEIVAAGGIGYTGPQLHVIKTECKRKFKIVTLRQQTTIK